MFELPCLWSDTCMEGDKGQKRGAPGLIVRTALESFNTSAFMTFFLTIEGNDVAPMMKAQIK